MDTNFKDSLTPAVTGLNQTNEELQDENKRLKSENEELKSKNNEDYIRYQRRTQEQAKRIAELEAENEKLEDDWRKSYANECITRHKNHTLEDRIKELEAAISKMETTAPKWISVEDRLPNEKEQRELLWIGYTRADNTIKYMYEALFDDETKQFYMKTDWDGYDYFIEPSVWMVVPQPTPTTEEKR